MAALRSMASFEKSQLDVEQVQEYLFLLQNALTPSQTYFKHCVYGLRFLLKPKGSLMSTYIYLR
jgi:hypothetical protein